MQVKSITALSPDKIQVSLGEIQKNDGTGPGAGPAMGGGSFTYEVAKADAPKVWDIQTISVNV